MKDTQIIKEAWNHKGDFKSQSWQNDTQHTIDFQDLDPICDQIFLKHNTKTTILIRGDSWRTKPKQINFFLKTY
jgi:hypothetical protein